jgi:hypothetical protein
MEMRERDVFGLLFVLSMTISLAYATVMTVIKTNTELDTEKIERLYAINLASFNPEPHEFQRFALYCVLICTFGIGLTFLYRQHMNGLPYRLVRAANLLLVGLFAAAFALTQYATGTFGNDLYLTHMSFYHHLFFAVVLFALAIAAFILWKRLTKRFTKLRLVAVLFDVAMTGLVFYFSRYLCYYDLNANNGDYGKHFSVVFNPIFALSGGHTPGVDFEPIYGLYGYFFYYLQRIVWGDIHYRDTVVLMGALIFVGNMALYIYLVKMFRHRFVAAVTMVALLFFIQLRGTVMPGYTPYYAYLPIRTITPMITLCLIAFIHTAQTRKVKTFLFVLAAFVATGGILWNPETGLIATATLVAYAVYCNLCKYSVTGVGFWRMTSFSLIIIGGVFLACFLALQLITIGRSGELYPLSSLFWSITAFSGDGFYMIPLPKKHPYIHVLASYSVVVVLSLYSLFARKEKPNIEADSNALGFSIGIMGFGLFMYFLGRSHPNGFARSIWPAFIALAYIAMKLYGYCKQRFIEWRDSGYSRGDTSGLVSGAVAGGIALLLAFFIFATGLSLFTVENIKAMKNYNAARTTVAAPSNYNVAVVDRYRTARLFMLNEYSMFYLSELGLKNDYRGQAPVDFFFKQDYMNIVAQLERYQGRVFISANYLDREVMFEDGGNFKEKMQRVLQERYMLIAEEGGWLVFDLCYPIN